MFKKKNKNLHRALIALMVLGLLVCLCFTLASAATAEPGSSSAAETTAVEEQGAQSNTEAMTNFLNQAGIATLIHNADWKSIVMILISFVLMYLAIGKGFEPLLLLPIAFGMLLTNLRSSRAVISTGTSSRTASRSRMVRMKPPASSTSSTSA